MSMQDIKKQIADLCHQLAAAVLKAEHEIAAQLHDQLTALMSSMVQQAEVAVETKVTETITNALHPKK